MSTTLLSECLYVAHITETLSKHTLQWINEFELQLESHYWTFQGCQFRLPKRCCFLLEKLFECKIKAFIAIKKNNGEYSCCEITTENNVIGHVLCVYRFPICALENNILLNQVIEDISKLKDELLIVGYFNYPTIDWRNFNPPVFHRMQRHFLQLTMTDIRNSLLSLLGNQSITNLNLSETLRKRIT